MKSCITCGMPLEGDHANDIGLESPEGLVCKFDVVDGALKSPEEIFEGGVQFFASKIPGGDKDLAARLTRRNMKALAYWQKNPFALLGGEEATDAEFDGMMTKLMNE